MSCLRLPSLAVWLVCLSCGFSAQAADAERPNILLLLSDDHSYPFLSCYGDGNVKTPTLDRLAAEGIKFHRYFTAAPQCVPSRASLMTGRSPVAARMTRFSSPLPRDEVTLPELLRAQGGYFTGVCGRSYHLDGSGQRGGAAVAELLAKHELKTFADRVDYLNSCPDNQVAEQIGLFLDKKPGDKPFFLWANFSDPHHVWNAPSEFRPDPASLKLPAHWPDLPGMREQLADYCAEVNRIDRTIAGVLDVLKQRGLLDSTLIVFTGDNGAALPHGKGSLYDPGSNVPLVVRWPGVIQPGGESRSLLSGEDITPTLLDAAGLKAPAKMSGVSFLPLLKGEAHVPRRHIFVERGPHGSAPVTVGMSNSGYDLSRAVRSDRFKFIYNCTPWIPYSPVDSSSGAAWTQIKQAHAEGRLASGVDATYFTAPRPVYELYDLDADPSELTNISGQPQFAAAERELRIALAEKMILDFDYLPLPAIPDEKPGRAGTRKTRVSIRDDAFFINDQPTYAGRNWNGRKIEGLLLNSRMVQATFDDLNPETRDRWAYPDTKAWDAERNLNEFLAAMPTWRQHGLLAITVNWQGGSPQGYSKDQPWHNSGFTSSGELRPKFAARMRQVIERADELGMVVIVGYFYFGQDQRLADEAAVIAATEAATNWLLDHGFTNVLVEVNNECNVKAYDHAILKPDRIHELIDRVRETRRDGQRLLVGTSYGGGAIPRENVVRSSDFLLLHGNGVKEPSRIVEMVRQTRRVPGYRPMPILFNEDDHFDFDRPENNFTAAVGEYASWGYFDYRMAGEGFDEGFQSVPVNWSLSSDRKRGFFRLLADMTGAQP